MLARCEAIRAHTAVMMGLAASTAETSTKRPVTPKLAVVAAPRDYTASCGKLVSKDSIDLLVRILSMGKLHHAMTGTGAVALAVVAAIRGTVVHSVATQGSAGNQTRMGHPSGTLEVGAEASHQNGEWTVAMATMSRSVRLDARRGQGTGRRGRLPYLNLPAPRKIASRKGFRPVTGLSARIKHATLPQISDWDAWRIRAP